MGWERVSHPSTLRSCVFRDIRALVPMKYGQGFRGIRPLRASASERGFLFPSVGRGVRGAGAMRGVACPLSR